MNRRFRGPAAAVLLGVGLAALAAGPALACAVCGHATSPDDPMAAGFYWGILFLMAMPFSVLGAAAGWLAYRHWRARGAPRPWPAVREGMFWRWKETER